MKISSIIIAKDEEKNIGRCIQSQVDCIDEIIVLVDEHSKDSTLQIVKSFSTVKYEVVKWQGFSATKKYAVTLTLNDWIFWIDADEVLTPGLSKELIEFKKSEAECDSYSFPRKANFLEIMFYIRIGIMFYIIFKCTNFSFYNKMLVYIIIAKSNFIFVKKSCNSPGIPPTVQNPPSKKI